MAAKFEVYSDKANKFRFRLKAPNGEIIAQGEAYESKAACLNGIKSIKTNAAKAAIIDETEPKTPAGKSASKKPAAKKAPAKKAAEKKPAAEKPVTP